MREYRNRICSAVLAAGTACICKFGDCYGDEQRGDFIREKNKR